MKIIVLAVLVIIILLNTPIDAIAQENVIEEWVARYSASFYDIATQLVVDAVGNVYVSGQIETGMDDIATVKYDASGVEQWVTIYSKENFVSFINDLAVDSEGNVYICGNIMDEDNGLLEDYITVKYNALGIEQWVAIYDGTGSSRDIAFALTLDDNGNIYVTGQSIGSDTGYDFATIKYDSEGNEQWIARYNGPENDNDHAIALTLDAIGNVYVTGYCSSSGNSYDYATVKYNANGIEQWVNFYNGPGNGDDYARAIGLDQHNNIYITGHSTGSGTGYDYATVKYNADGVEQWVNRYSAPGNGDDYARAIGIDPSNNIYITGHSTGYATVKYNADGVEQWVSQYYGPGNGIHGATALAIDGIGNVYVTGYSTGSETGYDYATIKYNDSGIEQWAIRYNGTGNGTDEARAIASDASGHVYVTGYSFSNETGDDYATIKYVTSSTDLTISNLSNIPEVVNFGNQFGVDVTVDLSGDPLTKGTYVEVKLYASTDETITTSDYEIGISTTTDFLNSDLNSMGSITRTLTASTSSLSVGNYYIGAIVDPTNYHPETNENNNSRVNENITIIGQLTLNSPNGGEIWTKGFCQEVTWSSSPNLTGFVLIQYYKGGTDPQYAITPAITNNNVPVSAGIHTFEVSNELTPGNDYLIGMSVMNGEVWDFSDDYFNIQNPVLSAPILINPQDGATTNQTPTFEWSPVSGQTDFQLLIDPNQDWCTAEVNIQQSTSANSHTLENPLNPGSYYWKLAVATTSGISEWSEIYYFNVTASAPTLIQPEENSLVATETVLLSWTDVNAEYYRIWLDNDLDFQSPEIKLIEESTEYTIPGFFLAEGTYYWKVVAYFGEEDSTESEVSYFHYDPPKMAYPVWIPLYRMYKSADHDHFYCTTDAQRQLAINSGYKDERVEGYIAAKPFDDPDMVNLYRLYSGTLKSHYYCSDVNEKDARISEGYTYEGIIGYAYAVPLPGLEEFYHLSKIHSSSDHDNFYTISEFERDNAISAYGFTLEGTIAYVSETGDNEMMLLHAAQLLLGMGMNAVNGNLSHYTKTSFDIPGVGPPLVFEHIYNSLVIHINSSLLPLGPGWSHSYHSYVDHAYGNNQAAVVWPGGNIVKYNKNGSIYSPVHKGVYDTLIVLSDRVFEVVKKNQMVFHYEVPADTGDGYPALLNSIRDRNNNTLTLTYETGGLRRLRFVTDPAGRQLELIYHTESGRRHLLERVRDPLGRSIRFTYNSDGILTSFYDALERPTQYTYVEDSDYEHLLKEVILPKGNKIDNSYQQKKINSQSVSGMGTLTFNMDNPNQTTVTNAQNKRLDIFTTPVGGYEVIERIRDGLNNEVVNEYTDLRNPNSPTRVTDKNGQISDFVYDRMGNVLEIRQPLSVNHYFVYDAQNNLLTYTDPRNKSTNYSYDGNGNLISITDPRSHSTSISRLTNGLIQSITNPMGHTTQFSYDTYGNVQTVQDPLSNTTSYTYDIASRLIQVNNAKNQTTSYAYFDTDLLNTITNAANGVTRYTYDANDNLETITDPNNQATQWTYNNLDLVTLISNPMGNQKSYTYNTDGTLNSRSNPAGDQTSYTYDDALRIVAVNSPTVNGSIVYDANGNITSASCNGLSLSITYDALNRIDYYTDGYGNTIDYGYDAAGNITSIQYASGKTVSYTYYDDNRLATVRDWNERITAYGYRADGSLYDIVYPNGVRAVYSYDGADRLTGISITKSGGEVIASYEYTLDELGNITATSATEPMAMADLSARDISLSYDAANRLTSAGSDNFTFNANGNLISRSGGSNLSLTYDSEHRLTAISGDKSASYVYDLFGNRRSATRNGVTRRYALDINGPMSQVLFETDENNNVINYYVYGLGLAARIKPDGTTHYYHYNNIGNVVAMTDQSQNVTHKYCYDPFGEVLASEEADANPFRFVGQFGVMDEGNGLFFMRARYYDFDVGRFISEDPIWDENLYSYAENSPLILTDTQGKQSEDLRRISRRRALLKQYLAYQQEASFHEQQDYKLMQWQIGANFIKDLTSLAHPAIGIMNASLGGVVSIWQNDNRQVTKYWTDLILSSIGSYLDNKINASNFPKNDQGSLRAINKLYFFSMERIKNFMFFKD